MSSADLVTGLHLSEKMGKKLLEKFPEDPGFKGREDGYDDFTKNAQGLLEAWARQPGQRGPLGGAVACHHGLPRLVRRA